MTSQKMSESIRGSLGCTQKAHLFYGKLQRIGVEACAPSIRVVLEFFRMNLHK